MGRSRISRQCGIYKILCRANHKAYYGSTNDWTTRKATHRWALRNGQHHCSRLQNCWNKYGEASFEFVWLENIAEALLAIVEQEYLDHAKDKINSATDAERPMIGRRHTEEWKRQHAAKLKGRKWSSERRLRHAAKQKPKKVRLTLREIAKRKQLKAKGYYPQPNGRWRVMWSCADGKRRTWTFDTEDEAAEKVSNLKRDLVLESQIWTRIAG